MVKCGRNMVISGSMLRGMIVLHTLYRGGIVLVYASERHCVDSCRRA